MNKELGAEGYGLCWENRCPADAAPVTGAGINPPQVPPVHAGVHRPSGHLEMGPPATCYGTNRLQLRLHKAEIIGTKGGIFFQDLMDSAKRGVAQIKAARSKESFQELNALTFKVTNLVYPAVTVEVRAETQSVAYSRSVLTDAGADAVGERGLIEFKVDSADNLCLVHNGRSLTGKDEALHLLLDPVFKV